MEQLHLQTSHHGTANIPLPSIELPRFYSDFYLMLFLFRAKIILLLHSWVVKSINICNGIAYRKDVYYTVCYGNLQQCPTEMRYLILQSYNYFNNALLKSGILGISLDKVYNKVNTEHLQQYCVQKGCLLHGALW